MRLINKALILISIFWLVFLTISFVNPIHYSSINFIILIGLSALTMLAGIYQLLIRRIEQLNQRLSDNIKNNEFQPIEIKGNDELSTIAMNINQLLAGTNKSATYNAPETDKSIRGDQEKSELMTSVSQAAKINSADPALATPEGMMSLAHYDALTALPNHVFFNEILNKALNHAKRRSRICAILIIDLNNFKNINDTYGFNTGDQVLKQMAVRFNSVLRAEDILARLNADEFIVLLNDIGKAKFAGIVAEKLLQTCLRPLTINEHHIIPSASIGICIYPNDAESLEDLLKHADSALTTAKQANKLLDNSTKKGSADKSTYQFYNSSLDIEAHAFIELENELRKALQNNELSLFYQPKLHLKKGKITGVEALIRWVHPKLGMIDPSQLISVGEETGLSMQIGEWAIREACRINKYWQDEGYEHITVSVNLSPKQFHHPEIANCVAEILQDTQLEADYLELEINEATVMDDVENATEVLNKIKETGVHLSIDHFGTGYTSISHLKKFPISNIKIDKSFIKGLPHTPNDAAITKAFIALAHHLGLEVVASGVETAEQVQYLSSQDCDMVQGYYLSHPLPAQKIVSQFAKLTGEVLIT